MTSRQSSTVNRRTVLTGAAASLGTLVIAGCADDTGDDEGADDDGDELEETTENSSDDTDDTGDIDDSDDSSAEVHAEYETTEVAVTDSDGEELGTVTAAIADTPELQGLGLSDTEELPDDRGMLFVYEAVEDREFFMREMSFGIDIVFADDEGVITEIHHAPEPGPDEDGSEQTYAGRGQYVLEVVYEWTDERDVEEGDRLEFEL
ncbi:DUF192 domain-containing protein [Natronorubrum sp. DTA28]|uniref:DUF192 domain-containing protein n=1 Tax=Natronorubrum sp. DTA28 TaxID=3447019 RepID=UPI003F85C564